MNSLKERLKIKFKDTVLILKNDKKTLFKGILIGFLLIVIITMKLFGNEKNNQEPELTKSENKKEYVKEIYIDISGEIKSPGVYKFKDKTRLFEVIEMAGGLKNDADVNNINRASYVEDGAKIIIPSKSNQSSLGTGESYSGGDSRGSVNGKININIANKESLMSLNGIGDAIADRIIEERKKKRFSKIEDIMDVKGIGNATFEKIKSDISV